MYFQHSVDLISHKSIAKIGLPVYIEALQGFVQTLDKRSLLLREPFLDSCVQLHLLHLLQKQYTWSVYTARVNGELTTYKVQNLLMAVCYCLKNRLDTRVTLRQCKTQASCSLIEHLYHLLLLCNLSLLSILEDWSAAAKL